MTLTARVFVVPRRDVLDPQGKAVGSALHSLGYGEVGDVRVGRYVEVVLEAPDLETARRRLGEMADRLLANPVVEDWRIEIGDLPPSSGSPEGG